EVMSRNPKAVRGDMLASAAMEFMQERQVTVLFLVGEAGVPHGILHIHDLLRAGVA
ncbi:CBS domain-containing protein, partial [Ensifer aridi]|uniref:CBS domain-containing protein n=1 Tax=Ensifer aridi TaxID=1708715 RepID=UPI00111C5046